MPLDPAMGSDVETQREVAATIDRWIAICPERIPGRVVELRVALRLRELVAAGAVRDARHLLSRMAGIPRASRILDHWLPILAPVRVEPGVPGEGAIGRADEKTLRSAASHPPARWVAVRDGTVVATADSLAALRAKLSELPSGGRTIALRTESPG
jgi:hypothetical protein